MTRRNRVYTYRTRRDAAGTLVVTIEPHRFVPLRWRDRFRRRGDCRKCYLWRSSHPTIFFVAARPAEIRVLRGGS